MVGLTGVMVISLAYDILNQTKRIPATSEVQSGFVNPSKLVIKLQYLDSNGQK